MASSLLLTGGAARMIGAMTAMRNSRVRKAWTGCGCCSSAKRRCYHVGMDIRP